MPSGSRSDPFIPTPPAAAVFVLGWLPGGLSLRGKPGLGGFEPARGAAPIEAAVFGAVKELLI
jgi:hypothetical protein